MSFYLSQGNLLYSRRSESSTVSTAPRPCQRDSVWTKIQDVKPVHNQRDQNHTVVACFQVTPKAPKQAPPTWHDQKRALLRANRSVHSHIHRHTQTLPSLVWVELLSDDLTSNLAKEIVCRIPQIRGAWSVLSSSHVFCFKWMSLIGFRLLELNCEVSIENTASVGRQNIQYVGKSGSIGWDSEMAGRDRGEGWGVDVVSPGKVDEVRNGG